MIYLDPVRTFLPAVAVHELNPEQGKSVEKFTARLFHRQPSGSQDHRMLQHGSMMRPSELIRKL
jgi:hypothetical protein